MSTVKNIFFMGSSTAIRLGCSMLTFIFLARTLGPEQFGSMMLWLSVATLMCMIPNYGIAPYMLREIAKYPERSKSIMGCVLTMKLTLSIIVFFAALLAWPLIPNGQFSLFIIMLLAVLCDMFSEYFNVGLRANNKFSVETKITSVTALLQFLIVYVLIKLHGDLIYAAIYFFISKLISLFILVWVQKGYFEKVRISSLKDAMVLMRKTSSFSLDFGFQNLFGQIDSVVINAFIGSASVGIYQSGMRIFMGGAQCAGVLSNVLIGDISALLADRRTYNNKANNAITAFTVIGLFGWLGFYLLKFHVESLFGSSFVALSDSAVLFGALFFVRFCSAGMGLILTINGLQMERMWCTILHWVIVFASLFIIHPEQINDWLYALLVGNASLAMLYGGVSVVKGIINISLLNATALIVASVIPAGFLYG